MSSMVAPLFALLLAATTPVIETKPAVFHSNRPKAAVAQVVPALGRAAASLPAEARHDLPALSAAERARLSSKDARGGVRRKRPAEKVGIERTLPARVGFAGLPFDLGSGGARAASGG